MTYRLGAHSSSDDPSGYRSKEEEAKWQQHDPVKRFKLWLINKGWLAEADDAQRYEKYREEVLAAVKVAENYLSLCWMRLLKTCTTSRRQR